MSAIDSKGGTAFRFSGIENRAEKLPRVPFLDAARGRWKGIEAAGLVDSTDKHEPVVVDRMHGFVRAVWLAFDRHFPLSLSPDHFWLLILQGVAKHVEVNAERLRGRFVAHEGKETIVVRRDDFEQGSAENDWPAVAEEMTAQMKHYLAADVRPLFTKPFSTTSALDTTVAEIALMDAMKQYFDYYCLTSCGIPEIALEGTPDDWDDLRDRVDKLRKYDDGEFFQKWLDAVSDKLDNLCRSARGDVDEEFWKSFFKHNSASGGPYVTGWINAFIPYLDDSYNGVPRRNNQVTSPADESNPFGGVPSHSLPSGVSSAPFRWVYYTEVFEMKFVGGFFGVSQNKETLALRPCVAWAVVGDGEEARKFEENKKDRKERFALRHCKKVSQGLARRIRKRKFRGLGTGEGSRDPEPQARGIKHNK